MDRAIAAGRLRLRLKSPRRRQAKAEVLFDEAAIGHVDIVERQPTLASLSLR